MAASSYGNVQSPWFLDGAGLLNAVLLVFPRLFDIEHTKDGCGCNTAASS